MLLRLQVRLQVRLLAEHVPPAAVQEAVQDVGGDDVRERERRRRLEAPRGAGQHGAHGVRGGPGGSTCGCGSHREPRAPARPVPERERRRQPRAQKDRQFERGCGAPTFLSREGGSRSSPRASIGFLVARDTQTRSIRPHEGRQPPSPHQVALRSDLDPP